MKTIKSILLISVCLLSFSCTETLPKDSHRMFASQVVGDLYNTALLDPVMEIAMIHKVSAWRDASNNTTARYQIEDDYFSKIAPRSSNDTITVITTWGYEYYIVHNDIPVGNKGAEWYLASAIHDSGKKITLNNSSGTTWECKNQSTTGEIILDFSVTAYDIDSYVISINNGTCGTSYQNSPVASQKFSSNSPLSYAATSSTPYSITNLLELEAGQITIELIDENGDKIEDDDIIIDFDYDEFYFNPTIQFRGDSFNYSSQGWWYYE